MSWSGYFFDVALLFLCTLLLGGVVGYLRNCIRDRKELRAIREQAILDLLDEEAEREALFVAHLPRCPQCRAFLASLAEEAQRELEVARLEALYARPAAQR